MPSNESQTLYGAVEDYARFGDHRSGTDCDRATASWFADRLRGAGASVETQSFVFPRFDAQWRMEIEGAIVPAIPLFYGPAGRFNLRDVPCQSIDLTQFDEETARREMDQHIRQAIRNGASALLIRTLSVTGDVYAMNTHPSWRHDLPVMFVGNGPTNGNHMEMEARIVDSEADVVLGRFDRTSDVAPLIITTPLSGWFTCAGERGTGVSFAIVLAEALAHFRPIVVIGTSGHEFQYLGSRHYLDTTMVEPGSVVLHLGSSLATRPTVASGLFPIAHVTGGQFQAMSEVFKNSGTRLVQPANHMSPESWQGESEHWAPYGCQMLSLAGFSPAFHTPADTPQFSTTPELMAEMYAVILEATKRMIGI